MKPEIHPNYHDVKITCSCGHSFVTRSTLSDNALHVEVCSKCHPFFTGKQKLVDTAGRVERFRNRFKVVRSTDTNSVDKSVDKEDT